MKKKIECIFFDLDGTLIESGPDLLDSLNYVLLKNKMPEIPNGVIGNLVGGGAANMLKKAYKHFNKEINKNEIDLLVSQFLDFYSINCSKKTTLYEAVESTLEELKLKGIKMCICTNKKQYLAEKIILDLGVNNFFSIILGSTDKIKLKPDSSMLRFLINKLSLNVDEIIMVGDSENDIIPSNELGITSVFVEYGYGDFSNSTPTYKIKNFKQLLDFL